MKTIFDCRYIRHGSHKYFHRAIPSGSCFYCRATGAAKQYQTEPSVDSLLRTGRRSAARGVLCPYFCRGSPKRTKLSPGAPQEYEVTSASHTPSCYDRLAQRTYGVRGLHHSHSQHLPGGLSRCPITRPSAGSHSHHPYAYTHLINIKPRTRYVNVSY